MKIRKATIKDFKDIQKLNYLLFKKEYEEYEPTFNIKWPYTAKGKDYFKRVLTDKKKYYTLICKDNERAVGYLIGLKWGKITYRNHVNIVEVENMYVDGGYRGKNVGSKMVKMLGGWAKKSGANKLRVGAITDNNKGISFYKRLQFKDYEIMLEKDL